MKVGSRCTVIIIAVATRVCARMKWVVCLYSEVSTYELDDAITHDHDF